MKTFALLLLIGCGHGAAQNDPIPAGTFCFTLGGQPESCVTPDKVTAHQTLTTGNVWFKLDATVMLPWHDDFGNPEMDAFPVSLSGQVPMEAQLPRAADQAQLSVPLGGMCRHYRATSPFGGCGEENAAAICQALEQQVTMTVVAIDAQQVELEIAGNVDVRLPDAACCNNMTATCNPPPPAPQFMPAGPYPLTARIHAHF